MEATDSAEVAAFRQSAERGAIEDGGPREGLPEPKPASEYPNRPAEGFVAPPETLLDPFVQTNPDLAARAEGGEFLTPNPALVAKAKTSMAAVDKDRRSGTSLIAGFLLNESGEPVAGQRIRIDLEPSTITEKAADDSLGPQLGLPVPALAMVKLGETRSKKDGSFSIRVTDLGDLSGYLEDDGSVSVLVTSSGAEGADVFRHLLLRPPSGEQREWTWASADQQTTLPGKPGEPVRVRLQGVDNSVSDSLLADPDPRDVAALRQRGGSEALASFNEGNFCSGGIWWRSAPEGVYDQQVSVRVARIFNWYNVSSSYTYRNGSKTEVSRVASFSKGSVIGNFEGGLGRTEDRSRSVAITQNFSPFTSADMAIDYVYRPHWLFCHVPSGFTYESERPPNGNPYFAFSGAMEWRPEYPSGGGGAVSPAAGIFKCGFQGIISLSDSLEIDQGGTYTYNKSVSGAGLANSIFGLSLTSQQTYSEDHKLTFFRKPGTNPQLCGRDNVFPPRARQVKERVQGIDY